MRIYLLLLLFPIVGFCQDSSYLRIVTEIEKDEIFLGECVVVSYSAIYDKGAVYKYSRIDSTIMKLREIVDAYNYSIFFEKYQPDIRPILIEEDGVDRYKLRLFSVALCPLEPRDINVGSLDFCFLKKSELTSSKICISTDPRSIRVNSLEGAYGCYTNYYGGKLIGDFKMEETVGSSENYMKNGYIDYNLKISGYGNLHGFNIKNVFSESVNIIVEKRQFKNDFFYNDIWSSIEFDIKIYPNKLGQLDLGNYFEWTFYSLENKGLERMFSGTRINLNRLSAKTRDQYRQKDVVVVFDNTFWMSFQDAQINRVSAAREIISLINEQVIANMILVTDQFKWIDPKTSEGYLVDPSKNLGTCGNAILEAIRYLEGSSSLNRTIIFISAGAWENSNIRAEGVAEMAMRKGIKVHSIAIGSTIFSRLPKEISSNELNMELPPVLKRMEYIASSTGGRFFHLDDWNEIDDVVTNVVTD